MTDISRTALFGKLNAVAYKAIEGATVTYEPLCAACYLDESGGVLA